MAVGKEGAKGTTRQGTAKLPGEETLARGDAARNRSTDSVADSRAGSDPAVDAADANRDAETKEPPAADEKDEEDDSSEPKTTPTNRRRRRAENRRTKGRRVNRDAAYALVCQYTQSESLRRHMLAVEAAMRAYARKFGRR